MCEPGGVLPRLACTVALLLVVDAAAYQADLVPITRRPEGKDVSGLVSIGGADGTVHVTITDVNDAAGDPVDGGTATVQLRVRVNGIRRRLTIPVPIDGGDGDTSISLGLRPGDAIVVQDLRVRGPDHRILAGAGALTVDSTAPGPSPQPTPAQCPAALVSCQSDLADCNQELDDCQSQ
jgi:hypothetical protein